jgi:hypothetical protein
MYGNSANGRRKGMTDQVSGSPDFAAAFDRLDFDLHGLAILFDGQTGGGADMATIYALNLAAVLDFLRAANMPPEALANLRRLRDDLETLSDGATPRSLTPAKNGGRPPIPAGAQRKRALVVAAVNLLMQRDDMKLAPALRVVADRLRDAVAADFAVRTTAITAAQIGNWREEISAQGKDGPGRRILEMTVALMSTFPAPAAAEKLINVALSRDR